MSISSCPPPSCLILHTAIRQLFLPRAGDTVWELMGRISGCRSVATAARWCRGDSSPSSCQSTSFMLNSCGSADAWEASPAHPSSCRWLHSWLLFPINWEKKGRLKTFGSGMVWDWVVVLVCPILSQRSFTQKGCWPIVTAIICKVPLLSAFYASHCPRYRGGCRPDLCTQREKKLVQG